MHVLELPYRALPDSFLYICHSQWIFAKETQTNPRGVKVNFPSGADKMR
jgi:hypothetical protein